MVRSRGAAREAVASGKVAVEGIPVTKPSSLVAPDTALTLIGEPARFVSRGGEKLDAALAMFDISVAGGHCLDVGASTGGFTDCLLKRGAASVTAIDVGYGQLDWTLRQDTRVTVVERTNFRHVDPASLGAPFDHVVADLSFISLALVAPKLAEAGDGDTSFVVLVKPQFEAGREAVGRGGVVKDPEVQRQCIVRVEGAMAEAGYPGAGVMASPLVGPAGNREFLLWCRRGGTLESGAIASAVAT